MAQVYFELNALDCRDTLAVISVGEMKQKLSIKTWTVYLY